MKHILTAACASLMIGSAANALDLFATTTVDYGRPHAGSERMHANVGLGLRQGTPMGFWGLEASFGVGLNNAANYDTQRLDLQYGWGMVPMSPFVSAGYTNYSGGVSSETVSLGIGIEPQFGDGKRLRIQAIRDFNPDSATSVTVLRAGLLWEFN